MTHPRPELWRIVLDQPVARATERPQASAWPFGVTLDGEKRVVIPLDPSAADQALLLALLDSWDPNNTILVNLLRALPDGGLEARAIEGSPCSLRTFIMCGGFGPRGRFRILPRPSRRRVGDGAFPQIIAQMLHDSAKAVSDAVKSRVEKGRAMDLHYDHPILLLQHMLWHEGYRHGQIKLALKAAGKAMDDQQAGPLTWGIWMRKSQRS